MKHLLLTTIAAVLLVGCGEKPLSLADVCYLKVPMKEMIGPPFTCYAYTTKG